MGVVIATLAVFGVPYLVFSEPFDAALLRAITFMIVASPCAVVLSTMPPLLATIANAGRHGVLVKSADVIEDLGRINVVAFDKTGTLTEGAPEVTDLALADGTSADEILASAAAVERYSEHPLGRAIVVAARTRRLTLPDVEDFRALPGRGVTGHVAGRTIIIERGDTDPGTVGTTVAVHADGHLLGSIVLVDRVRTDAADTVATVATMTASPVHLLTGDNDHPARHVAEATGVATVHHSLLPQDKTAIAGELETSGHQVLLVGDGINDAPALAHATVGIAMGRHGSDLALDTADGIIVRDELSAIPNLIRVSRRARRLVIANLTIAATFITVLVTWDLAYHLPLPLAVAGHEGSTVIVALNGLRLLRSTAWNR